MPLNTLEDLQKKLKSWGIRNYKIQRLPFVALHDDIFFENYDYDVISPDTRKTLSQMLPTQGFKQKRASLFVHEELELIIPRSNPSLSSNPVDNLKKLKLNPKQIVLTTPSQLLIWALYEKPLSDANQQKAELTKLVSELSANLDKTGQLANTYKKSELWENLRIELETAQKAGIESRKASTI